MKRIALVSAAFVACASFGMLANAHSKNRHGLPSIRGLGKGEIVRTVHPLGNDLLTAGLGSAGIAAGAALAPADPLNPTAEELRRTAIHGNYRALIDPTPGGGYGTFYGPGVAIPDAIPADEIDPDGQGRIPGVEYLAFVGHDNVTAAVQIPDHFDENEPCIVAGPSSGSRGVYGAIGTSGEWGLKKGCAVVYTDKGTGAHNLQDNTVNLIQGERADEDDAGKDSNFTARIRDRRRDRFNNETPDRYAFKHAHSKRNPEKDWGRHVLQSIEFAFYTLNAELEGHFTPENTIVIASSVSNGGGSSLRAAEQDKRHLIDGVAVTEPNVNPVFDAGFVIQQGDQPPIMRHSRSLYGYTTALNVYQGCANLAVLAPLNFTPPVLGQNRCESLADLGLISALAVPDQAAESQAILNADFAIQPEQNVVQPSHWWLFVSPAIAVTYANAYARTSVLENLCGYSFAATNNNILDSFPNLIDPELGRPVALQDASQAVLFATSNGIPPTGGVNLVNNDAMGGPHEDRVSTSPATGRQDQNLNGALCLRALATGIDPLTGRKLRGRLRAVHKRIRHGVAQVRAHGDLKGRPTLIATGRNDAILPINHTSRPYFGLNQHVEGDSSNLRYYEVLNAQHLDTLIGLTGLGFDALFIPLHHYFIQFHNILYDHLKNGTPLPPSQVVRTTPRGPGAAPLEASNIPDIDPMPSLADRIVFQDDKVMIPE